MVQQCGKTNCEAFTPGDSDTCQSTAWSEASAPDRASALDSVLEPGERVVWVGVPRFLPNKLAISVTTCAFAIGGFGIIGYLTGASFLMGIAALGTLASFITAAVLLGFEVELTTICFAITDRAMLMPARAEALNDERFQLRRLKPEEIGSTFVSHARVFRKHVRLPPRQFRMLRVPAEFAVENSRNDAVIKDLMTEPELRQLMLDTLLPLVVKRLKNSDAEVRRNAASALARVAESRKELVPFLKDALDNEDSHVRYRISKALGRVGKDAYAALKSLRSIALLDDEEATSQAAKHAIRNIERAMAKKS